MFKLQLTPKNILIITGALVFVLVIVYFFITYNKMTSKPSNYVEPTADSKSTQNSDNSINTSTLNSLNIINNVAITEKNIKPQNVATTSNLEIKGVINNPKGQVAATTNIKNIPVKLPSETMAWIYPGSPTCGAKNEYSDGRKINILKPEYFNINEEGKLILLSEKNSGCNGYSVANIADLKKHSTQQYATISSSYAVSMGVFLDNSLNNPDNINTLISFVVDNNITGLEIDFEDFGGWNKEIYTNYKQFLSKLGTALHEKNKKLMIDGPATSNSVEDAWYFWNYSDFNNLPVDKIVVMTYDYQYDQGAGQPISPISWITNTINWTLKKINDKSKLSFGIPSYGYRGIVGANRFSLLTYDQIKKEPGFDTAVRDSDSFEMTWRYNNNIYFYQDSESMSKKLQAIQNAGIKSISVWHLGGNLWFNK